jgi:hypothetical protein
LLQFSADSLEHFEQKVSLGSFEMKPGLPNDASSCVALHVALLVFDVLEDIYF